MYASVNFLNHYVFPNVKNDGGINHKNAFEIIKRQYCEPMFVYDLCPKDCRKCAAFLSSALELKQAKNPGGLLVCKLREEVSKQKDIAMYAKEERIAASNTPLANFESSGNIFDDFLAGMEKQLTSN